MKMKIMVVLSSFCFTSVWWAEICEAEAGVCQPDEQCMPISECAEHTFVTSRDFIKLCGVEIDTDKHCCKKNNKSNLINDKSCGISLVNRIKGGTKAEIGEHPWIALLFYRSKQIASLVFGCSGSLITERHILTAAHCAVVKKSMGLQFEIFSVRLGEHTISTKIDCIDPAFDFTCYREKPALQDIEVESIIIHPSFNSKLKTNDIAMLRLKEGALLTKNVRPICLPVETHQMIENLPDQVKFGTIAGWGRNEKNSSKRSDILMKANVLYVTNDDCNRQFKEKTSLGVIVNENQLCAGGNNSTDACKGDSGGPLTALVGNKMFLQGIVSFGIACNVTSLTLPGVYVRVSKYIPWILENIS